MSEVFEGYERQYCEVSASLSRKCTAASALDGEKKKQKLSEIQSGVEEAESLIRKMDLEARSLQPSVKAGLLAKLREYKSDLNNLKSELKRISSPNAKQATREELLEAGMADTLAVSTDQRGRLLMTTERLNQSTDRIKESRRTMLETEELGVSILQDLHQQRQSLLHAHTTLHGVDDNIGAKPTKSFTLIFPPPHRCQSTAPSLPFPSLLLQASYQNPSPAMSGSGAPSGRGSAGGSRSFDFGADDVLCSYDDFAAASEPKRPDPADKDFHDSRLGRPFVKVYEQESYGKEDVLSAVEKCMKKYADNLLRSLEGITSRLSQLEIYCYKLERSIGELRGDVLRDETGLRLKSLEKHLHEVHRSIQILRDKQELTEAQKELAKFQLTQDTSKKKEHVPTPSFTEPKKLEEKPDAAGQQLALVLPQQVNSPSLAPRASEPVQQYKDQLVQQPPPSSLVPQQDRYVLRQAIVYYPQRQASGIQDTQGQQVQPEVQYLPARPPAQDVPVHASSQQPQAVNQTQPQSFPPYQQQWHQQSSQPAPAPVVQPQQTFSQPFPPPVQQPQLSNAQQFPPQPVHQPQLSKAQQFSSPPVQPQQSNPQLPPQAMQPQHPPVQTQVRPQTPPNYPHYPPHQPLNPAPETLPGSAAMQGPYNTVAPSGGSRSDVSYSYGGPVIPPSQPPPQHNMQRQQLPPPSQGSFGPPPSKGVYGGPPQYAPQGNSQGYNTGYGYPPSGPSAAQAPHMPPGGVGMNHPGSHMMRGHPYGEMIEKAITMGYPRDQVLNVIQRMTESGQPVDFNTLLDRLNEAGSRAHPRVW